MSTIDSHSDLRTYINAVSYNVKDSALEAELTSIADRVYADPATDVLRDLDMIIGQLKAESPAGLAALTDRVDMARRAR